MNYFLPTQSGAMTGEIEKPHVLLTREMARLGVRPTDLAKLLDVQLQTVLRWKRGRFFNEENQEAAALAMGLPPDHFKRPDLSEVLAARRASIFEQWLASTKRRHDIVAPTGYEQGVLARMAEADPTRVPVPGWFSLQLAIHRGELSDSEARNIEDTSLLLDAEIAEEDAKARPKPLSREPTKKTSGSRKNSKKRRTH